MNDIPYALRQQAERYQAFRELLDRRLATPSSEYIPVDEAFEQLYQELGIEAREGASGSAEG
ncbi:hypothetical protein ACTJKJ_14605 [Roseateles sp. 22389]|uniref:hypothetical protein n=1 Tax=Roseateles sp. 22389 TaxID=3453916 RepID=UPI003F83E1AA